MIQFVFTVYDSAAKAYLPPFMFPTRAMAERAFSQLAVDRSHNIGQSPKDYTLFELGTFDDSDASYSMYEAKEPLGLAIEYRAQVEEKEGAELELVSNA